MARVEQVIPDPASPGMYLALIEPGSYLDFVNPVPFSGADAVVERSVLNMQGRIPAARSRLFARFRRTTSADHCVGPR